MQKLQAFLSKNSVIIILVLAGFIGYQALRGSGPSPLMGSIPSSYVRNSAVAPDSFKMGSMSFDSPTSYYGGESVNLDVSNRMSTQNVSMSVVVEDVPERIKAFQKQAEALGGFVVNSSTNTPEEGASGSLSVRVPRAQVDVYLSAVRDGSMKVVSENVNGHDITDQYQDNAERLRTLNISKQKMEQLLQNAERVEDILNVQQQLSSLQSQIEQVQGQVQYLEQIADSTLITLYVSTDEYSLPYAPAEAWRPAVVFKLAVRSMVMSLRGIGSAIIWLVVYTPLIALAVFTLAILRKILARFTSTIDQKE